MTANCYFFGGALTGGSTASDALIENKAVTCAKWDIMFRLPPTGDIIEPALTMWQRLFKDPRRPSTGSM